MRSSLLLCLSTLFAATSLHAAPSDPPPRTLETTVVVSGAQPGPGLWKVSKGDHVMWVLGTLSPLPDDMEWITDDVVATIADSQEVLLGPSVEMDFDIGVVRGMFLLPRALGARNNPDDKKLVDVVPPELYARWQALKARYMKRSRSVERRRPLFAAQKLYEKAVERSDLSFENIVSPVVRKAAKKNDVPITEPTVTFRMTDTGEALREFAESPVDDLRCFELTLDRLETDLENMRVRGNAWAVGDVELLRELPYTDQNRECTNVFLQSDLARSRGFDDIEQKLADAWLKAAENALANNTSSFALLPFKQIVSADGYVAALREKGYRVEEPE